MYINGNARVELYPDGTRIIETEDTEFRFEYPLNIDIRLSSYCPYGMNPKTGKAVCSFCHESASADIRDKHLDFTLLKERLSELPEIAIELAVGVNYLDDEIVSFFEWATARGFVVNATVNSMALSRSVSERFRELLDQGSIKGLGISYRPNTELPELLRGHPNTVVHVIAGIDDVVAVHQLPVRKILILGEKDFGFNKGKVILSSSSHQAWKRLLPKLIKKFDVTSFDNLALEQLDVKRLVDDWDTFYQGEHSFYINAVDNYYAPSSRSGDTTSLRDFSIKDYYGLLSK